MTSLDTGIRTIRTAFERVAEAWRWYDSIPAVRRIHAVLGRPLEGGADGADAGIEAGHVLATKR